MSFRDELGKKLLFFDGAMGTMLQERGLQSGELPEIWNVTKEDVICDIHRQYLKAGCDIVKANTLNMLQMRNLAKSSMKIRIRMVELEENADEREDFLKFWQSKAGEEDKIQLMPMHTWSGKIADEEKRKIDFYADKPCVSVFSSFTINYDGKVQLCDSDIEQQEIVGDIREQSIRDIWQGGKMEQIRGWHADEKRNNIPICQGCDHWSRHFKESIGQE